MTDTILQDRPALTAEPATQITHVTQVSPADFTYSHAGQSRFRRTVIRTVEKLSGQPMLRDMYFNWAKSGAAAKESLFDAALRLLNLTPLIKGEHNLTQLPKTGGLLLVANHPFGIVDGLTMGYLGMRLRGNVRIMTNSLLCRVPELDPHLLPVDFSGTPEARKLTAETRRVANELLAAGKVVAIFPAGNVATANAPLFGPALDCSWHPFVGRLATLPAVTTLPIHFSGQNSRLFQMASHTSYPLRVALIFHETRRRMGGPVNLTIGEPIAAEQLRQLDRGQVAEFLRRRTIEMTTNPAIRTEEVFVWPKRVRW